MWEKTYKTKAHNKYSYRKKSNVSHRLEIACFYIRTREGSTIKIDLFSSQITFKWKKEINNKTKTKLIFVKNLIFNCERRRIMKKENPIIWKLYSIWRQFCENCYRKTQLIYKYTINYTYNDHTPIYDSEMYL